jgi:phytoene dehydrogenase-like protein
MTSSDAEVVIVGAGLAGLACAVELHLAGRSVTVLEASDGVGGRVRTDHVDGFTLDRGFQILFTNYPELAHRFDRAALDLRAFQRGADVWSGDRCATLVDPRQAPRQTLATLRAPIGSVGDRVRLAALLLRLAATPPRRLLRGTDEPIGDAFRDRHLSAQVVAEVLRPLVGGMTLDPDLGASTRIVDVLLRGLVVGEAVVPAAGMAAIPEQLAALLPAGALQLGRAATSVKPGRVETVDGEAVRADHVVVATEGPASAVLLDRRPVGSRPVGAVYFATDEPPTDAARIQLGVIGHQVVNGAVMSNVAPTYAPPGRSLVVVATPGTDRDVTAIGRAAARQWWGASTDTWDVVAEYRIPHGQPDQRPPFHPKRSVSVTPGLWVCGDHRDTASIQGALHSGRRTAAAILAATT